MIGRNDPCWCGSGLKWKKCHFPNPGAVTSSPQRALKQEYLQKYQILIKDPLQIEKIREACQVSSKILDAVCKKAQSGVSTQELDDYAFQLHKDAGAIPAPLGYGSPPYPKSICTSINEVICHGIPDQRILRDGDILNIDVASIYQGYYGDCGRMVTLGEISLEKQLVVDVSYECLMRAIEIVKPGIPIWKIGEVIEDYAKSKGCSVVNQFVGHGVGLDIHEAPQIPHHYNQNAIILVPGMIFTIEPMINAGVREAVIDPLDKWTARTKDNRPSAQWEHALLVTETGHDILTCWKK